MNRPDTKLKLIILSLLLALGGVSFVATRARLIRTAWRMSHSRPDNSETIRLRIYSLCEEGYRYQTEGKYERAEPPLRESLRIAEETFGPTTWRSREFSIM